MLNTEKALNYMRQLDLPEEVMEGFIQGKVKRSTNGILFPADEYQRQKIKELESDFPDLLVWHIISNTLIIGTEKVELDSYLLVTEHCKESLSEIYEGAGKYSVFAHVNSVTWPGSSKFGEIVISIRFGGIERF